jgi:N-acetylmuramoyl-L-alanine amidase
VADKKHVVRQCESVQSVAAESGYDWEKVWKHPANAELARKRDPDVLYPGDVLVLPEKAKKQESGATEDRHRFKRRGYETYLRLTFLEEGRPRQGASYWIDVEGRTFEGKLDGEGRVDLRIPTGAEKARVRIGSDEEMVLLLAGLDPIDEVTGYQARLSNLGLYRGAVDGDHGPLTDEAIRAFQARNQLDVNGKMDDRTRAALEQAHGDKE